MGDHPQLGLVLGGGGARGLAHIGVLKVLEEAGIQVDLLAGASMGGVIGAAYAAGMGAIELEHEALRATRPDRLLALADPLPLRGGLVRGDRISAYLATLLGDVTFGMLHLPLSLVAVDLLAGEEIVLRDGSVVEAVRATIAIPGLLAPVEHDGRLLVDGGVLNNLPVDVARAMGADRVLAVSVVTSRIQASALTPPTPFRLRAGLRMTVGIVWASLHLMLAEMERQQLVRAPADLVIRPEVSGELDPLTSFVHCEEIIARGEQATRALLPQIRRCLDDTNGPRARTIAAA